MFSFALTSLTEISFDTTRECLENNVREIQTIGFYVNELRPTLDERVQVVAKKLLPGMPTQTYEMLHVANLYERWERNKQEALKQKYVW